MKTIYKKLLFLLLALPFSVLAQSTLSGTVTDKASGQPLPGVNVVVEGSNNGVSTDFDGKYQLTNLKGGETVVFSYIGYKNASVKFNGQASANISLEEDANQLQEVVVQVGYGTVKKKDATGSLTTVTAKDFNKGANVTTENLLNGRVAGLVINTSGAPGSGSQIRIRGGASLFASNDPLIVIDGLPIDNTTISGSTSFLASLNPSTIESITVLKDASSTAIYGSRASNGVIIITTKSGSKNLSVDYNFQYGSGKHTNLVDVFSGQEFRKIINQNYPGPNGDPSANFLLLGQTNTNWQEEIYRRTDYVDNNLSLKGNLFGFIPTRFTIGNTYQEGLRLTNKFNRNTASVSMNPSFMDNHLKLRLNANVADERNRFADGVEGTAIRFDPTQPVYDADSPYQGFFEYYNPTSGALLLAPRNPVAQLLQTNDSGKTRRFFGNFELDYKFHFFPDMRAVVNVGFDQANGERSRFMAANVVASAPSNGNDIYGKDEYEEEMRRSKLLDAYLVYNKLVNDFNIEVTAGYSYQKFESTKYTRGNVNAPTFDPDETPDTYTAPNTFLIGLFARTNLSFKDKYLLTLSYRRDGSSKFEEGHKWGNFPAASFAWRINEEFFKDNKTVSDLKLRLGYGVTGQQNVDSNNLYLSTITTGDAVTQYIFGSDAIPVAIPNATSFIRWEETSTLNAGFDFGFLNNRITGSFDAFYKKSEKLLVKAAIPDGGNNSNRAYQNVGDFTTKGLELNINAQIVKTEKFNWNVNFNASTYQRKIDKLIYNADIFVGENVGGTGTPGQILSEGFSPYSFYVYKQLYDTDGHPIEGAYADLNRDGQINASDRYIYKNPDPDVTMGLASSMNIGNLDFSFNMRASIGNYNYNGVNASQAQFDLLKTDQALNNTPRNVLTTGFNTTSNVLLSDIYIENASFLRMDNITVGYTFPKWFNSDSSLRLSLGIQNAFVITDYSGLDPEITNNGLDKTIYPRQRQVLFGVNVKF